MSKSDLVFFLKIFSKMFRCRYHTNASHGDPTWSEKLRSEFFLKNINALAI